MKRGKESKTEKSRKATVTGTVYGSGDNSPPHLSPLPVPDAFSAYSHTIFPSLGGEGIKGRVDPRDTPLTPTLSLKGRGELLRSTLNRYPGGEERSGQEAYVLGSGEKFFSSLFLSATLPLCFLLLVPWFSSPSWADTRVIQIKGSDTMVNLGQAWAEEFMNRNPEVTIAVTGGGSGTGIAALVNRTATIAQCSRSMKPEEKAQVLKSRGKEVKEFIVGMDALAVIVHPANPVSELSIDRLSDIFTGKITRWNELGGLDEPILVLSRERNSGTHVYFLEEVVRKGNPKGPEEFAVNVLMMPSSQAIAQEVARSRFAIGYLGIGYVTKEHKAIAVRKKEGEPAVAPSVETGQNGTYPIARPLYIYTAGEPEGDTQRFIEFAQSPEGQEIVALMDFVPLETTSST